VISDEQIDWAVGQLAEAIAETTAAK